MITTTIFRQINRPGLCKGLTDLLKHGGVGPHGPHRYAAATGIFKNSLIFDYHKFNVGTLRAYANLKKQSLAIKTIQKREIIQDVLEKNRDIFIERKNVLVKDIRDKRTLVKEKVREKIEEVVERENIFTIPNYLTVGRAILSPYIGFVIVQGDLTFAIFLLGAAGVSDFLDGQIARRWPSQSSKFGSFIDPMADKLLIGSLVISMGYCDLIPVWLAGTVLFRDVFLIAAGFAIRYISLPQPRTFARYFDATYVTAQLEPTLISKVNTAVQLGTIGLSLAAPVLDYTDHSILHGLWYLTGATTVIAALSYILNKNTYKILSRSKK